MLNRLDGAAVNEMKDRGADRAALQSRVRVVVIVVSVLCALTFLWWPYSVYMRAPAVGTFHDDGVYLVTAKALATGSGYRIISLPGEPRQTKYPILFPWLLSLVWRIAPAFPANLFWLRLVPFGSAVVWLWLSWRLLRRLSAALSVVSFALLLTAISPWTLFLSTTLLSETLFAALVTASLLMLVRIDQGDRSRHDAVLAGALASASVLTRTAGMAPAAAGLLVLAVRRRWREAGEYAAVVLLLSLPWFWWTARHAGEPIPDPFYSGSNYASWNIVFNYSWPDKLAVFGVNTFWATQFGQFWGLPLGSRPAWAAAAVCSVLVIRGFWVERRSPACAVCAIYLCLLLVWAFPPVRFMVPVLPLLVWLMFAGAGRLMKPVAAVLGCALVLSSGAAIWRLAAATSARGGTWLAAAGVDDWHQMARQYEWIARNTSPDAVVLATHDPTVYLFTGRKALRPSTMEPLRLYYNVRGAYPPDPAADAEALRDRTVRNQVDYIVMTPRDDVRALDALMARFPGAFVTAGRVMPSRFEIYRVNRDRIAVR